MVLLATRVRWDWYIVGTLVFFGSLTALRLTPSHYGFALNTMLGVQGHGPIWGKARHIRSDEFAMWTALFQVAVNNRFQRYNETSLFREDLRNFEPLPLLDWALIFKPSYWLFFLSPSFAYALFNQIHAVMLIVGFYLIFRRFGVCGGLALGGSLLIWMSGYVQTWWINLGIKMAYIPWMTLVLVQSWSIRYRALAFLVMFTQQMLSTQLYPPIDSTNVVCAVLLAYAIRPESVRLRVLLAVAVACILACAIVFVYLQDSLRQMFHAPGYGGRRRGGGDLPWYCWLANFFPGLLHERYVDLTGLNICEASTIGSFLLPYTLFFIRYSKLKELSQSNEGRQLRRCLVALGSLFVALTIWQLLPCPWWMGAPLYWHGTWNQRLSCYVGMAVIIAVTILLSQVELRITLIRILLCVFLIVVMLYVCKVYWFARAFNTNIRDLLSLCVLVGLLLCLYYLPVRSYVPTQYVIMLAALIGNFGAWGMFNPIQSSIPIFLRPDSQVLQQFRALQAGHPDNILVTTRFVYRAILNGYGFRTPHVIFPVPPFPDELKRLRHYITEDLVPDSSRFNCYFQLWPTTYTLEQHGKLLDDMHYSQSGIVMEVPVAWFLPPTTITTVSEGTQDGVPEAGFCERIYHGTGEEIHLHGFAHSSALHPREFKVFIPAAERCEVKFFPEEWPDLGTVLGPEYILSGFVVRIRRLGEPFRPDELEQLRLDVIDPVKGHTRLPLGELRRAP